jgi:hypothetical protein
VHEVDIDLVLVLKHTKVTMKRATKRTTGSNHHITKGICMFLESFSCANSLRFEQQRGSRTLFLAAISFVPLKKA